MGFIVFTIFGKGLCSFHVYGSDYSTNRLSDQQKRAGKKSSPCPLRPVTPAEYLLPYDLPPATYNATR
jgi:hypothetical protein